MAGQRRERSDAAANRERISGTQLGYHGSIDRQYFPKGTDLSVHTVGDLDAAADELNDRPRKRLGSAKPIEGIGPLLLR